ncbi:MAG TPA: cache domain-containing protein, partial [Roseiflexaceae bacterium]|nr:cache domain-containing protein [Roseiflexaceae bacterium]
MRFWIRLALAMVSLALFTALAAGLLAYRFLDTALEPIVFDRLATHTETLASKLNTYVHDVRADVLSSSGSAPIEGIVRARLGGGVDPRDGSTEAQWLERLAHNFAAELSVRPTYTQFRLIGVADGGREIVRVDRSGPNGAIRIVPAPELQPKGDRDYFTQTLQLPPGAVYISPIQLNQERGVVETPHLPVLRAATPVHAPDGMPFGIVVINIDMRPLLAELRASVSQGGQVFLVDEQGNYLLNPDPAREFGADLGRPSRLQDDFPEIADLAPGERVEQRRLRLAGRSLVVSAAPVRLLDGPRVLVIEMVERSALTAIGTPVRQAGLLAGLLAVVAALTLAVIFARSLSRPLGQMTTAVASFDGSEPIVMPAPGNGELGELAQAFERMSEEVRAKTLALEQANTERAQYADQVRLF